MDRERISCYARVIGHAFCKRFLANRPVIGHPVKDRIIKALSTDKQTKFITAYLEVLKGAAKIVFVDKTL